jgi:hypothetical protein
MSNLRPIEITPTRVVVTVDSAMRRMVEGRFGEIEDIVRRVSGARVELAPASGETAPVLAGEIVPMPPPGEPEIVRLAAELFGARVVNVQRKDRSDGNG